MSEQSLQALAIGNQVRFKRAALRAWVKEPGDAVVSRHRLADLIAPADGLDDALNNLHLEAFLLWGFRIYPRRRQGCYELADTNPTRTLGALTPRQRGVIADALRMPEAQLDEARRLHAWERRNNARAAA